MSATSDLREMRRRRREAALALRAHMSPSAPAPESLRIATWNVNSLRARTSAISRFLSRTRPDVICLQETKTTSIPDATAHELGELGYEMTNCGNGAYNGVAIASPHRIDNVAMSGGFGNEYLDREPRLVTCVVETPELVRVASVYVPHGRKVGHWHYEYKLNFLAALRDLVRTWVSEGSVVIGGDVNVAPTNSDIFHPDAFVGLTHVTDPERTALAAVLDAGLIDLDAARWGPHERRFTWWNHGLNYSRNLGMRIDLLAADARLAERLTTTWIDHLEREMDRPSDHAALVADFERLDDATHVGG